MSVVELSGQAMVTMALVMAVVFWVLGFWAGTNNQTHRQRKRRAENRRRRANDDTQWVMPRVRMLSMPTRPWPSIRSGEVVDTKEMDDVP